MSSFTVGSFSSDMEDDEARQAIVPETTQTASSSSKHKRDISVDFSFVRVILPNNQGHLSLPLSSSAKFDKFKKEVLNLMRKRGLNDFQSEQDFVLCDAKTFQPVKAITTSEIICVPASASPLTGSSTTSALSLQFQVQALTAENIALKRQMESHSALVAQLRSSTDRIRSLEIKISEDKQRLQNLERALGSFSSASSSSSSSSSPSSSVLFTDALYSSSSSSSVSSLSSSLASSLSSPPSSPHPFILNPPPAPLMLPLSRRVSQETPDQKLEMQEV